MSEPPDGPPDISDATLLATLAAARGGDPRALDGLLRHLGPGIRRVLRRRLADRPTPEGWWDDVLQEALFRIARDVPACRATTAAECWAWAITVAWHAAVDALAAPSAAAALLRTAVPFGPAVDAETGWREFDAVSALLDAESDPHVRLARLAVAAQRSLSDDSAAVLWLRLVQGATWDHVARATGTTPAGAKRRFQRAQATLRRAVLAAIARLPAAERAVLEQALRAYPSAEAEGWTQR